MSVCGCSHDKFSDAMKGNEFLKSFNNTLLLSYYFLITNLYR
jgi:hypothetical protein